LLPGLDGPELARRLVATWPQLRVLRMSGYVDDSGRIAEGDAPVLSKPFTMGALAARVRETLEASPVG
jgi:DNA-binding response OmpR family regulator